MVYEKLRNVRFKEESTNLLCDYRFGFVFWLNDFVMPNNYEINQLITTLKDEQNILNWNYDNVRYPVDILLRPATGGKLEFGKGTFTTRYSNYSPYVWQFPYEVIHSKIGMCADTSNFICSMLRAIGLSCFVVLGELRLSATNSLLGYHAWVELDQNIIETTLHKGQGNRSNIIISKDDAYNGKKLYKYVPYIWYNEMTTKGRSFSQVLLRFFGKGSPYENIREFLKAEKVKQRYIWQGNKDLNSKGTDSKVGESKNGRN